MYKKYNIGHIILLQYYIKKFISKNKIIKLQLENILNTDDIQHTTNINKCYSLKKAHIYCKMNKLSGQVSGPLIEKYIINKYLMKKNKPSDCNGDCNLNYNNIEIKISLGGVKHNKFNYVQIRFNHNIDFYLFTAYYLTKSNINNIGELFIFKIKKKDLINIIFKYGSYAHGSIKKNGVITINELNNINNIKEYALRPVINGICWNELLNFRVNNIVV